MTELNDSNSLPYDLLCEVDACCDRFEKAWSEGEQVLAEEEIQNLPEKARRHAIRELLLIEWQCRSKTVEEPAARKALVERMSLTKTLVEFGIDLTEVLDAAAKDLNQTILFTPSGQRVDSKRSDSAALHLRCPHCQNGVELLPDAPLEQITCVSCGSTFGLTGSNLPADTPKEIGRFKLIEKIGIGGFGTVWRARDPELDREVAIKVPRRSQLMQHEAELFFREARAAAQLSHPNIVPIHEVGRDAKGSIYIVSDLIRGTSLAGRLKDNQPTLRTTVQLLVTIAEALNYAHEKGVIHRDLKPSNIMLELPEAEKGELSDPISFGKPYLMDFGLAKREVGEITMTIEGQVLGTPAYMSPEQAGGQTKWIDRRSDIYSLGVMLFQLLTGELPFRGTAQSQIQQRQEDDAPLVRRLSPKIPLDLSTICAKCLERDQNKRYSTAAEVAEELNRYLRGEPVLARPISRAGQAVRWAKRYPARAIALVLGSVLAVVGPTAAVVISQQNQEITNRLNEITEVVSKDEQKIDRLVGEKDQLLQRVTDAERSAAELEISSSRRKLINEFLENQEASRIKQIEQFDESDPRSATSRIGMAQLKLAVGDTESALQWLSDAEPRLKKLQDEETSLRSLYADCCFTLSLLLSETGETQQAVTMAKQALATRRGLAAADADSIESMMDVAESVTSGQHLVDGLDMTKEEVRKVLAATLKEGQIPDRVIQQLAEKELDLYEIALLLTDQRSAFESTDSRLGSE